MSAVFWLPNFPKSIFAAHLSLFKIQMQNSYRWMILELMVWAVPTSRNTLEELCVLSAGLPGCFSSTDNTTKTLTHQVEIKHFLLWKIFQIEPSNLLLMLCHTVSQMYHGFQLKHKPRRQPTAPLKQNLLQINIMLQIY